MPTEPTAVDPHGCGCTECITGQYVPLERATDRHIAALLTGHMTNNTGATFHITATYTVDGTSMADLTPDQVTVHCPAHNLTWTSL
jgi:hypothetical protein